MQKQNHMRKVVSIIVPVYNSEQYLSACVDSILAQTYEVIELILVDDGSTDRSGEMCDEFQTRDKRVKVIHQSNGGIGVAQNAGLDAVSGEYITFCDNDDLMSPYLVERLVSVLEENDADMSAGGWLNIGASKAKGVFEKMKAPQFWGPSKVIANPIEAYQTVFSVLSRKITRDGDYKYFGEANWCKLYRSQIWKDIRFPVKKIGQDMYIANEMYLKMRRSATCLDPLYIWVQRGDSVTHSAERLKPTSYSLDLVDGAIHNLKVLQLAQDNELPRTESSEPGSFEDSSMAKFDFLPMRSYYAIIFSLRGAKQAARKSGVLSEKSDVKHAKQAVKKILKRYSSRQKFKMWAYANWRRFESFVYFYTIFRRK